MRKLILAVGLNALLFSFATAQEKWTLRQCVEYALANNISVKQQDIQARLAELTYNQSRLQQYPSASISSNAGINAGRSIDPTTNQFTTSQIFFLGLNFSTNATIFNWFSQRNTIAGNKYELEAANAAVDKLKNDIALNVASAYLLVLVSQEQANVAEVVLTQSQQNRDNIRKRVDVGNLPELEFLQADAQVARDSATWLTSKATVQQNLLQLKAVLNLDAATPFAVELPPLDRIPVEPIAELQPEMVYNLALANLPQQRVNELRIKAADKYIKSARGAMYPTFSFFAGMGTNYANNQIPDFINVPTGTFQNTGAIVNIGGTDYEVKAPVFNTTITTYRVPIGTQISENFRQNAGISLNIPLFNSGIARTNWQRSKLNMENLLLQRQADNQTLKQDIYRAYNDAVSALERYNAARKTVETSQKAFEFSQKRFDIGLQSTLDYLISQNNLFSARISMLQAQVEYVFRLKVLEFYKGQGIKL
ncbi:MAG TPA: TolC family protein [Chitinophagaceae bacterium]|nr:TolC family protein [Chitinophagaceae bacterium]